MSDFGLGGYQAVGSLFDKYINYSQARSMQQDMNEYNEPRRQIARLHEAGLSPWSYSGDGNTAAQPVLGDSRLAENLGSIADRSIQKRQVDANVKLAAAQEEQTRSLAETNKTLLKYLDESEQQRLNNLGASTGNLLQNTEESKKRVERYDEQVNADISLKKANEAAQYAQSDKCKAETNRINRMLSWEIKEAKQRILFSNEQIAVLKTQANLNTEQTKNLGVLSSKYRSEINKLGVETWAEKHSNEIWQKCGVKPGTPAWTAVIDILGAVINQYVP